MINPILTPHLFIKVFVKVDDFYKEFKVEIFTSKPIIKSKSMGMIGIVG